MHKEIIKKVYFFKKKPPHFIAFIGPLLKPLRVEEGSFVYKEGDPIESIYFLTKGQAAYVNIDINDCPYLTIDPGYYFGEIDFVYSKYKNLEKYKNEEELQNDEAEANLEDEAFGSGGPLRRAFSVKAITNCDILTLSKADLHLVESEFEEMVGEMFLNSYRKIRKILKIKD